MTMRARRRFIPSSGDPALEVRLSPAIVSLYAPPAPSPAGPVAAARHADPLPDPEPTPGGAPGTLPPPTSGPVGPGTS